jgi:glycerate dehydrogenase
MKIVVLDGKTLNPGDLDWSGLEKIGTVRVYDRSTAEETVERCRDCDAILTNKSLLHRETLSRLPNVRYIGVTATGYNIVDIEACQEMGIAVCNVPAYSTLSVAQLVFAFILEHCHHVGLHSQLVRRGRWSESKDFAFWERPLVELDGSTLGIVGYGNIGSQVARIGQAFGMKVLVNSRTVKPDANVVWVDRAELLAKSDFVTLHVPLTSETQGMINSDSIRTMKRGAFLINTGRGPLVVEQDLAAALNEGALAGAGLDVLSVEPPPMDNPLLTAENALVTPHIAWATLAARRRLLSATIDNLRSWVEGTSINRVV